MSGRRSTSDVQRLALEALAIEARGASTAVGLAEAGERAFTGLRAHLGRWLGPQGFDALLARALENAKAGFPFLTGVTVGREPPEPCLKGLLDAVRTIGPEEAHEGVASVLGEFLRLLDTFVGHQLTLRLLERVWPGLGCSTPDAGTGENEP